jgi:hypothetical protein
LRFSGGVTGNVSQEDLKLLLAAFQRFKREGWSEARDRSLGVLDEAYGPSHPSRPVAHVVPVEEIVIYLTLVASGVFATGFLTELGKKTCTAALKAASKFFHWTARRRNAKAGTKKATYVLHLVANKSLFVVKISFPEDFVIHAGSDELEAVQKRMMEYFDQVRIPPTRRIIHFRIDSKKHIRLEPRPFFAKGRHVVPNRLKANLGNLKKAVAELKTLPATQNKLDTLYRKLEMSNLQAYIDSIDGYLKTRGNDLRSSEEKQLHQIVKQGLEELELIRLLDKPDQS